MKLDTIMTQQKVLRELERKDGSAAAQRLAAGLAIYYREADTPPGHVIRKTPDGRSELIRSFNGSEVIVGEL